MIRRITGIFTVLFLLMICSAALAAEAPAVAVLGSEKAAEHLATHIGAAVHEWDGDPANMPQDDCGEIGHVHCYGKKVSVWDTPQKGTKVGHLYPGSRVAYLNTDSQFDLVNVLHYKNCYYANVRIYENGYPAMTGWVNADYIGCSCTEYTEFAEVGEHEEISLSFSLH